MCALAQGQTLFCAHCFEKSPRYLTPLGGVRQDSAHFHWSSEKENAATAARGYSGEYRAWRWWKKQLEQLCVLALNPTCIFIILFMKNHSRKTLQWSSLGTCKSFHIKNKARTGSRKTTWWNTEEHAHKPPYLSKAPGYSSRVSTAHGEPLMN